MTEDEILRLFTDRQGAYCFARWRRPIVPVVFGTDDATLSIFKGAIEAMTSLTGHPTAETDPELGVNMMVFFVRDWGELRKVPDLDKLLPNLANIVTRLRTVSAARYRLFRFEEDGAIRAAFVFIRMDKATAELPAADLALQECVSVMLRWSESAFAETSPLAQAGRHTILRQDIANLLEAAYDPVLPVVSTDASHALRLAARVRKHEAPR